MRPFRLALACSLALAGALATRRSAATPAGDGIEAHIDCAALDARERAAFEARAMADLALRGARTGTLAVSCEEQRATITWSPVSALPGTRTLDLERDGAATVDALLAALDELADRSEPRPAPSAGEEIAEPPDAGPTEGAGEVPSGPRFGLGVGVNGQVWAGNIPLALGGQIELRARIASSWSAWLMGGLAWGSSSSQGVHARSIRGAVGVDDLVAPHVRVGAGAAVTALLADQEIAGGTVSGGDWTLGVRGSAAYVIAVDRVAFAAGPEVAWLASPLEVRAQGAEVFRIPSVVGGLFVAIETGGR